MASLKALAGRSQPGFRSRSAPGRAAVTLQYVFLRPMRDAGLASAPARQVLHNAPLRRPSPGLLAEPLCGLPLLSAVIPTGHRPWRAAMARRGVGGDREPRYFPHFAPPPPKGFYLPFRSGEGHDPEPFSVDGGGMWGTVERNGGGWRREVGPCSPPLPSGGWTRKAGCSCPPSTGKSSRGE